MTFKSLLAHLVVVAIVGSLVLVTQNAQCTDGPSDALAQLQDAQLRSTLKSYATISSLLHEAPQGATLSGQDGKQVGVANLISLAQVNLSKCTEDHFRLLVDLRKNFAQVPLATYVKNVITQQRRFCEQYLDEQADSKVAAFSEPTRHDFELFLGHDKIGHDFYVSPEVSIVKLRSILMLAGDEQQQARALARGQYVDSCREITSQLEDLVPIRRDHDIFARLPMSCDRFFRAYEFCRNLVDFNFSSELAKTLFLDVQSRTEIGRFGGHLNALGHVVDRRQAIEAARALVRAPTPAKGRQTAAALASASERSARAFNRLRSACVSGLDLTENLRWLREHATTTLAAHYDAHLTPRALDYLRALDGCAHLVELQVDEVLQGQQVAPVSQDDQARPSRRSLRMILRKMFNAGN